LEGGSAVKTLDPELWKDFGDGVYLCRRCGGGGSASIADEAGASIGLAFKLTDKATREQLNDCPNCHGRGWKDTKAVTVRAVIHRDNYEKARRLFPSGLAYVLGDVLDTAISNMPEEEEDS
jgi:hypothetical protein